MQCDHTQGRAHMQTPVKQLVMFELVAVSDQSYHHLQASHMQNCKQQFHYKPPCDDLVTKVSNQNKLEWAY
jgi:hypothetical protein